MNRVPLTRRVPVLPAVISIALLARIAPAQTNRVSLPLRAAQLIGMTVEDSDGSKAGTIHNLILDTRSGQLKYAVIASGGILGVHEMLKLAPVQILSAATTKRQTLAVNATTPLWRRAPVFKRSQLASLNNPARELQIAAYFERSETQIAAGAGPALSATGTSTGSKNAAHSDTLQFASDLIGQSVVDHKHERIGEVLDLLVSLDEPHPAYAIISSDRHLHRGNRYAVLLSTLRPTDFRNTLLIDVDANTLEQAPPFTLQVWSRTNAGVQSAVYTFSKPGE